MSPERRPNINPMSRLGKVKLQPGRKPVLAKRSEKSRVVTKGIRTRCLFIAVNGIEAEPLETKGNQTCVGGLFDQK